jgi:hypothetical protein
MTQQTEKSEKVRVIIDVNRPEYRIYKKAPYVIPIIEENGKYRTGQDDLSIQQIMPIRVSKGVYKESEPLTEAQRKKYPYVINPLEQYTIKHLQWLNKKDDYDSCIYNLLILSGQWAENKIIYEQNPQKYHGYFEDAISEAIFKNNARDERFEAETAVRNASIDDYKRIALIFSFNVPNAVISLKSSQDELRSNLLELCDTHPKQMKMCFHKYNPGIDADIFILECIDANIIVRKDKGDLYHEGDYMGKTIEDVKRYLNSRGKEQLKAKFTSLLNQFRGRPLVDYSEEMNTKRKDDKTYIMECQSAIFENNLDDAKKAFIKVNKELYPEKHETLRLSVEKLEAEREASKESTLIDTFKADLSGLTLEKLQSKIQNKLSKYDEKDFEEIWDDKEKIIEQMIKIKFKK